MGRGGWLWCNGRRRDDVRSRLRFEKGGSELLPVGFFIRGKGSDEIAFELLVLHLASVCLTSRILMENGTRTS